MFTHKNVLFLALVLLSLLEGACSHHYPKEDLKVENDMEKQVVVQDEVPALPVTHPAPALTLPVRYQTPEYVIPDKSIEKLEEQEAMKVRVGASIRSTRGPQLLWDILKRVAALKNMNISWASDVDQNVLVDVDINSNDDFYEAIDNLLRQVDYFHEMRGNTIVVKYKETRQFHIAMPFTQQKFSTGTGGNILGSDDTSNNIDGTIALKSSENEFDIWKNIQANMDAILNTWNTTTLEQSPAEQEKSLGEKEDTPHALAEETGVPTRQVSSGGSMYIIDKPIGMVTVTAPRPLLERLETYFTELQKQLYKQIMIEAKIIEVELSDSSSIGINWSNVLQDFGVTGTIEFGSEGVVYPDNDTFVSTISLDGLDFSMFLNALESQGDTQVLSNPKLRVMNGQPALISVGENVTYVNSIESDVDTDTGVTTYTVDTERILSGVGMALTATVLNDDSIIMNLVPVTSELEQPIEYLDVGSDGATVGLPVVDIREMSTTVRMGDGEMLVIGGLISKTDSTSGEFAPVLGNIPLVRYLFGYEEKALIRRELIVLIKAQILNWSPKSPGRTNM